MSFSEGAVVLHCVEGEDSRLPDSVFEEAFPKWAVALQEFANAGDVLRAHYFPDFRTGVFIVVGGESLEDAKNNVDAVESSIQSILDEALKNADISDFIHSPCNKIEIGPIAILPR